MMKTQIASILIAMIMAIMCIFQGIHYELKYGKLKSEYTAHLLDDMKTSLDTLGNIELIEYAYMDGQRDYLNGNIKIKKENNKVVWTGSPWTEGVTPIFKTYNEYKERR